MKDRNYKVFYVTEFYQHLVQKYDYSYNQEKFDKIFINSKVFNKDNYTFISLGEIDYLIYDDSSTPNDVLAYNEIKEYLEICNVKGTVLFLN